MTRGLSVRKGKRKGEWSVYKYNVALFTGLDSKEFAMEVLRNQKKREDQLKK